MERKSFILHLDSLDVLEGLSNDQKAELLDAIVSFNKGEDPKLTGLMKAIFIPFRNQFTRDNEKYIKTVERNRGNGSKGGRPAEPSQTQNNPLGLLETQNNPIAPDNENDNKNDSDNDNDFKGAAPKPKKSLEQKQGECNERSLSFAVEVRSFSQSYTPEMLKKFFEYWSEPNKEKTKMKYEGESTWDLSRRLSRWSNNNFGNSNNVADTTPKTPPKEAWQMIEERAEKAKQEALKKQKQDDSATHQL